MTTADGRILTSMVMADAAQVTRDMQAVLPLFAWLSPSYPVGSYAYSHTLEWAVETGEVIDERSLVEWISDFMRLGAGRNDAILLCHSYRAVDDNDVCGFIDVNDLALALAPSAELHLETSQQGRSFLDATLAAWPSPRLILIEGEVAFPAAIGMAAAAHGVPLAAAVSAYLLTLVQTLVSAAIRSAPIGQTAGTRVCAAMVPVVSSLAEEALSLSLDEIGAATFRADLGSFHHETQYTRLFRS